MGCDWYTIRSGIITGLYVKFTMKQYEHLNDNWITVFNGDIESMADMLCYLEDEKNKLSETSEKEEVHRWYLNEAFSKKFIRLEKEINIIEEMEFVGVISYKEKEKEISLSIPGPYDITNDDRDYSFVTLEKSPFSAEYTELLNVLLEKGFEVPDHYVGKYLYSVA